MKLTLAFVTSLNFCKVLQGITKQSFENMGYSLSIQVAEKIVGLTDIFLTFPLFHVKIPSHWRPFDKTKETFRLTEYYSIGYT